MNFSTDRDLLAYEPGLFIDLPLQGQERLRVNDGVASGALLTSAAADFEAAQVDAGAVALLARAAFGTDAATRLRPVEVVERIDAHALTVSLPRARADDAVIPPGDGQALELVVRTFAPQAAQVHDALLRMLGIDPDDQATPLNEAAVLSRQTMAKLEALGTLERAYAGAVAMLGDNGVLWAKAADYHRRFVTASRAAKVRIDLDGDGVADVTRHLGVVSLSRL